MKRLIKRALAGAFFLAIPLAANALTLTIEDVGTGDTWTDQAPGGVVANVGQVGGFYVSAGTASIERLGSKYQLESQSFTTTGIGHLRITAWQSGLSDLAGSGFGFAGSGSVSNGSQLITIQHYIRVDGTETAVGPLISFAGSNSHLGAASQQFDGYLGLDGTMRLMTVIDIYTTRSDQVANINASLVAAVPVPAAGLLLATALAGVGLLRRRRSPA